MTKLPWTPWHQVVSLREDIRSGELSLNIFAADLYDVMMGKAKYIYQDPAEFFALTYPTYNLRELAKEVVTRLLGRSEKAIQQLELTYGGGKTHTLITLYHLTTDPEHLPDLPSVKEFTNHIGFTPPQTRVAILAFNKLDVEKGMEVIQRLDQGQNELRHDQAKFRQWSQESTQRLDQGHQDLQQVVAETRGDIAHITEWIEVLTGVIEDIQAGQVRQDRLLERLAAAQERQEAILNELIPRPKRCTDPDQANLGGQSLRSHFLVIFGSAILCCS